MSLSRDQIFCLKRQDESDVVAVQISDDRRKRETHENCKKDSDCAKGQVCVPYLGCSEYFNLSKRSNNGELRVSNVITFVYS